MRRHSVKQRIRHSVKRRRGDTASSGSHNVKRRSCLPLCPTSGAAVCLFVQQVAQLSASLSNKWHSCRPLCPKSGAAVGLFVQKVAQLSASLSNKWRSCRPLHSQSSSTHQPKASEVGWSGPYIYTLYAQYFWQRNQQMCGHKWRIYTVLAILVQRFLRLRSY